MKMQKGFTLIELMIVVAIIAILAAIAIPQYNDYTARAQLSEATTLLGGLKTPITSAYSDNAASTSCVIPAGAVTTGKYVASIAPTGASATNCGLLATMKTGISAKASGKTVTFTYVPDPAAGAKTWTCTSNANDEVKPNACKPDAT